MRSIHRRILLDMLSLPTAPFAEHAVVEYIRRYCAGLRQVRLTQDQAGNLLARVAIGSRRPKRPVCLTAHIDHPGFVADRMVGRNQVQAFWHGGVTPEYFPGARVRFSANNSWVPGRVRSIRLIRRDGKERVHIAVIDLTGPVPVGAPGMWDFPDPYIRGQRVYARGCDDIAGAAALLCAMETLVRRKRPAFAYFHFTRAEEVGYVGALAAARKGTIPGACCVVAVETSSERANARLGDGPILRVGDKSSTFTSAATAFCGRVAEQLAVKDRTFRHQRKLMDGGTCESSAYCALGYDATGLCVALGNYHNMNVRRKRLGPEYIDLDDWENLVKWFVALGDPVPSYTGRDDRLLKHLGELERRYFPLLNRSARTIE